MGTLYKTKVLVLTLVALVCNTLFFSVVTQADSFYTAGSDSAVHLIDAATATATAHLLVVCVQFPNQPATHKISAYQQLYFGKQNSVADYYRQVSAGLFHLTGAVVGDPLRKGQFLTLPHNESYYAGKGNGSGSPYPHNDDRLVADTLFQLLADGFNFTPYVQDGKLPYLSIVFSGIGADVATQNKNLIWPVENTLGTQIALPAVSAVRGKAPVQPTFDYVSNYDLVPEMNDIGTPATLGVFAHEFGHLLGLDDLYDTSSAANAGQGVGPWSLMGTGNWNGYPQGSLPAELDPYSRLLLGWIKPIPIRESMTGVILPPIEKKPVVYALLPTGQVHDYFLIDNVQNISYDKGLPETGVLIWHVDAMQAFPPSPDFMNNVLNTPSQNKTKHYDVAVESAGGTADLTQPAGSGTYDDTYPGADHNNRFTADSKPNNDLWNGQSVGLDVTNIAVSKNGNATFDVLDRQSGAALTIVRPNGGLEVYQGRSDSLAAQFLQGAHAVTVSNSATWYTNSLGVSLHGSVATFNHSGTVDISVFAHHLRAVAFLQVVALRRLKESVTSGVAYAGKRVQMPHVVAVYANGKVFDVTDSVRWRIVSQTVGRMEGAGFIGAVTASAKFAGVYDGHSVYYTVRILH